MKCISEYNLFTKEKKVFLFFLILFSFFSRTSVAQVGTLTGTGMSICNQYSFSICPTQTITPFNYGSQNYSCNNTTLPDVSFNIMGSGWRVMINSWFFVATVNGQLKGYDNSGALQTIPFLATNTITPLSYSGNFVQFAINGVASGTLLNSTTFSISINPVIFAGNSYTYCPSATGSVTINPNSPSQGGPWTYNWQPGNLNGNPVIVNPTVNTIYTVTVNSNAGCSTSATVGVYINCTSTTTAFFTCPDTVCVNQTFTVNNTSTNGSTYYWNFCQGNTNNTPQAINLGNIGFFSGPVFITIAKDGTDYYAFVVNNTFGTLSRLFFGSSLLNNPVATNLGNVSGAFPSSLEDLHLEFEGGNWYGIVVGGLGSESIIRISFGNSLANIPTAVNMGNIGGMSYPQRLKIFKNGSNYYGFTTNRNNNTITRFSFGTSITNTPTGSNMGNIGSLNIPDAIAIVTLNNLWYGYVINEGNNTISRFDFGNSLLNVPTGTNLGNTGALNGPRGIDMWTECNEIRGLITNRFSNDLINMNLPSGPTGPVITTSFGNIANFSFPHSITRFRSGDTLFAFITNVSNNTLSRIYYPGCTNASIASSTLTNPPPISYNAAGNYYVNLVVNEGQISQTNYCKQITVVNSISLTASSASVCAGSSASLSVSGASSYTWSSAGNLSTNGNSVVITPTTTTTYSIVGASGTCSNTTTSTLSVITLPVISISPLSPSICLGQSTSLTASGASTYSWSSSNSLSNNTGSTVSASPTTTTIYTVTGTVNTCTNNSTVTVTLLSNPIISLTPSTTICAGQTTTITASGATSYTWNASSNLSSLSGSVVTATPNVTEIFSVTGELSNCISTATTMVSVVNTPTLAVNSSSSIICPLGSASLIVTGASNYTWTPSSSLSSNSSSLVIASPSTTTTYSVIGTNSPCPISSQVSVVITVTNNPIIVSSNATVCSSSSTSLNATGGISYTWSPSLNLNTTIGATVIASPSSSSTIYTVSGSSSLGCVGSTSLSVYVIPTPTITIATNSLVLCNVGQSANLYATGANSYSWSPISTINSINTSSTVASPTITTIYSVSGSNGVFPNVCTSTKTVQINVGSTTTITVCPNDVICYGQSTTLYAVGGNIYHWTPSTGVSNPNDSTTNVKPTTTTIYTVTVSKNNICPVTSTVQVQVNPLPIVDAGKDSTINIDQSIVLYGTGNVNVGFLSPNGEPLICNWCPVVSVSPKETTCYTLEGFNSFGCRNLDEVCVFVKKEWDVFIPNCFTPNGDFENEYFIPKGYGISQIDLKIFDRWGVIIFDENNTVLGWDGSYKRILCPQGVYVYQVSIHAMSGELVTKTGHVTILSKLK